MIIFIKKDNNGAAKELGDNISTEINKLYPAKSIFKKDIINNITEYKNNIIVFIKYIDIELANILKENNKIYYIVVDFYPSNFLNVELDGIIYSNKQQLKDFSKFFNTNNAYVYYHHYSPSYNIILPKTKNIGYFVAPENVSEDLKKIENIDIHTNFNVYKDYISQYKFHIEYRSIGSNNFLYKPCIKLSTAAFAESVFICSKDNSYFELLPSDYPYFLTNVNQEIINDIINNNNNYKYALDIILNLKTELNINTTSQKLLNFLL